MNHLYTFLALGLADERAREAAEAQRASRLPTQRPNALRRGVATSLAVVSRTTANVARRLDDGSLATVR